MRPGIAECDAAEEGERAGACQGKTPNFSCARSRAFKSLVHQRISNQSAGACPGSVGTFWSMRALISQSGGGSLSFSYRPFSIRIVPLTQPVGVRCTSRYSVSLIQSFGGIAIHPPASDMSDGVNNRELWPMIAWIQHVGTVRVINDRFVAFWLMWLAGERTTSAARPREPAPA